MYFKFRCKGRYCPPDQCLIHRTVLHSHTNGWKCPICDKVYTWEELLPVDDTKEKKSNHHPSSIFGVVQHQGKSPPFHRNTKKTP